MYQGIVAVVLVLASCGAFGYAILAVGANHIGGATNRAAVSYKSAVAALALGVMLLVLAIVVGVSA